MRACGGWGGGRGRKLQYCGGCSVQWGIQSVHAEDNISTVEDNISTVGDNISTVENNNSTVEDTISTVEVILTISSEYEGLRWGGREKASVLWRLFSTVGDTISTCRG